MIYDQVYFVKVYNIKYFSKAEYFYFSISISQISIQINFNRLAY